MIKRFRWVFLVILAGGAILWWRVGGVGQDDTDLKTVSGRGGQQGNLAESDSAGKNGRESSRHSTGEVQKQRATPLKQRVAQLELLVEDKRKELVELVKTKGIISPGAVNDSPGKSDTPEDAAKKARDVQDFEDRKREYVESKELLKKLRIELALEQAKAKPGAVSR